MVRQVRQLAVVLGVLVIGSLGIAGVASAASGYPPPTTVGTNCSVSKSIEVGPSHTANPDCTSAPDSIITVTLNGGTAATTKIGESNSFVASGTNPASAFTGSYVMAAVIGSLAVVALGFLIVTFSRRRLPHPSAH